MALESAKMALRNELVTLSAECSRIKKALDILTTEEVSLFPMKKKLDPAIREKIRQGALKRWANKKKAPPAGKGK